MIGCGGAGKSTLAREIARRTELPLVHLDALYWRPGWVPTASDAWRRLMEARVAESRWIMDGNYGGTLDLRLGRAELVVFLDVPTWRCLVRVVARRVRWAGRERPSSARGCPERLTPSFLWWIVTYRRRRRATILERLRSLPDGVRVEVFRTDAEVRRFVETLGDRPGGGSSTRQ